MAQKRKNYDMSKFYTKKWKYQENVGEITVKTHQIWVFFTDTYNLNLVK